MKNECMDAFLSIFCRVYGVCMRIYSMVEIKETNIYIVMT